jgi:hypothetical protein
VWRERALVVAVAWAHTKQEKALLPNAMQRTEGAWNTMDPLPLHSPLEKVPERVEGNEQVPLERPPLLERFQKDGMCAEKREKKVIRT